MGADGVDPVGGVGSFCNGGKPGDGCMSDAVCSDPSAPLCAQVLLVPGILAVSTCGECRSGSDCQDPAAPNCSLDYDLLNFTGQHKCVADGSLPNDSGYNLADCMGAPVGDRACASGFCGQASVMGLLNIGVCGACRSDSDCPPGKFCDAPQVDLNSGTLSGSVCL